MIEIVGIIAGILTTASFVPQVVKILKTNDAKSISLGMYTMFSAGVFLWLIYGFLIGSISMIICNAVTLPLALVILYKKVKG